MTRIGTALVGVALIAASARAYTVTDHGRAGVAQIGAHRPGDTVETTTYRTLAVIPTVYARPDGLTVIMTDDELALAEESAAAFAAQIYDYSDGMGNVQVTVLVLGDDQPVTPSQYSEYNGRTFVSPGKLAQALGVDWTRYDFVSVFAPSTAVTAGDPGPGSFSAIATESGFFVRTQLDLPVKTTLMAPHEFMHWLERTLTARGYTNFPACGIVNPNQSIHCHEQYGYESNWSVGWYRAYMTGRLPDGTGVNAQGWSILPPSLELAGQVSGSAHGTSAASATTLVTATPLDGLVTGTSVASAPRIALAHPLDGDAAGASAADATTLHVPTQHPLAGLAAGASTVAATTIATELGAAPLGGLLRIAPGEIVLVIRAAPSPPILATRTADDAVLVATRSYDAVPLAATRTERTLADAG